MWRKKEVIWALAWEILMTSLIVRRLRPQPSPNQFIESMRMFLSSKPLARCGQIDV